MEKSSDVTPDPGGHGYCMDAAPTRTRVATCTHQPQHISDFTTTPWPALSPRHVRRYIAACRRRNGTNSRRAASYIVQSPQTQHTTSIATKSAPYTRHITTSALAQVHMLARDTPDPCHVDRHTASEVQHPRHGGSKRDLGSLSNVTAPDLAKKQALLAALRLRSKVTSPPPRALVSRPISRPTPGVDIKADPEAGHLSTKHVSNLISGQGSKSKVTAQALAKKQSLQPSWLSAGQENDGNVSTKPLSIQKAPPVSGESPCLVV